MELFIGFSTPIKFKPLSWLISRFLKTKYSHTFLCVYIPDIDRYLVFESTIEGVNAISLDRWSKKNKIIDLVKISDPEIIKRSVRFSIDNLHNSYSSLAILAIAFNIRFRDGQKRMICSEFVARSLGIESEEIDTLDPKELLELLSRSEYVSNISGNEDILK